MFCALLLVSHLLCCYSQSVKSPAVASQTGYKQDRWRWIGVSRRAESWAGAELRPVESSFLLATLALSLFLSPYSARPFSLSLCLVSKSKCGRDRGIPAHSWCNQCLRWISLFIFFLPFSFSLSLSFALSFPLLLLSHPLNQESNTLSH